MKGSPQVIFGTLAVLLTAVLTAGILLNFEIPIWLAATLAVNVIAVFFVGLDKSLSKGKSLRIPESILFLLALCGGALGVFVAMQIFRHKTQKAAFHFVLLLIFFAQVVCFRAITDRAEDREQESSILRVIV
jgi:uncharacterized membrane protein YsdA (DUF1294 family)